MNLTHNAYARPRTQQTRSTDGLLKVHQINLNQHFTKLNSNNVQNSAVRQTIISSKLQNRVSTKYLNTDLLDVDNIRKASLQSNTMNNTFYISKQDKMSIREKPSFKIKAVLSRNNLGQRQPMPYENRYLEHTLLGVSQVKTQNYQT